MKFGALNLQDAMKGTRAEKRVEVPGVQAPSGAAFVVLMRPLTSGQEAEVLANARNYAIAHGVAAPTLGDPLYDLGAMLHTLAIGCVDPDSPETEREASFDGGIDQIEQHIGPELVAYLYEQHESHQNACSPSVTKLKAEELFAVTARIAEGSDDAAFLGLAPATRCSWARFIAKLCLTSHEGKSPPGRSLPASS